MRDYDEKTTCCFTGHRILKKDFDETKITNKIEELIKKGYRTFLVGMALGFDSLVFEKLLNFKNYNIDVIACVPCREQDKYFSTEEKETSSETKPNETITINNTTDSIITTKVELFSTSYEITYDETHTMEDLNKLVIDYIEYLAYLEKWNGELPDVVAGDDSLSIIVPSNN